MTEIDEAIAVDVATWEKHCRARGLLMTSPRRAILIAMLTSSAPADAVAVLQAARRHHAATSMGTVYRLLRELEHHGLARAYAQPHVRLRWQLSGMRCGDARAAHQHSSDIAVM